MGYLNETQHKIVSDAVGSAEMETSGEILTVLADRSDGYTDVVLVWAAALSFTAMSAFAAVQPYAWHLMLSSPELSRVFNMAIDMQMRALARNTFCGWVIYGSEVYHAKQGENARNKPDERIAPILQTKGYKWE